MLLRTRDQFSVASDFPRWQRWALLPAFALLLALRLPLAWQHGRFLDEEATVFLAYAWHFPFADAVLRPFAGYLNLGATLPTALLAQAAKTHIFSLENAPYVTMLLGLLLQTFPALLLLTGKADWISSKTNKLLALLVLALLPATEEVYFNVLHIQFQLALCVALLLALDVPASRPLKIFSAAILVLAPLCGPGAIVFLPLFALRAMIEKDPARLHQILFLSAGSALQFSLFYSASPIRGFSPDAVTTTASLSARFIVMPLFGGGAADRVADLIVRSQLHGYLLTSCFAALAMLYFGLLAYSAWRYRRRTVWLIAGALTIAVVTLRAGLAHPNPYFALYASLGQRYNFLPLALLGLAIVGSIGLAKGRERTVYVALTALMLTTGTIQYFRPREEYAHGPIWSEEVQNWRQDHRHKLRAWPADRLTDLSDTPTLCAPPRSLEGDPAAPRYCESGWMFAFQTVATSSNFIETADGGG